MRRCVVLDSRWVVVGVRIVVVVVEYHCLQHMDSLVPLLHSGAGPLLLVGVVIHPSSEEEATPSPQSSPTPP